MSCFLPKDLVLPSLPGLPEITIPNPSLPNEESARSSHPSMGLPSVLTNWHPNLCDLLILLFIIFLILQGELFPNPTLEEAVAWVGSITSASDYFGQSDNVDVETSPAYSLISVTSFRAKVYPHDRDLIMKSIYDNYDSNNEFGNATTSGTSDTDISVNEMEAIFELNNLDPDTDISTYYELKKTQFTRNLKLTRV
jgi:hypothetical protein